VIQQQSVTFPGPKKRVPRKCSTILFHTRNVPRLAIILPADALEACDNGISYFIVNILCYQQSFWTFAFKLFWNYEICNSHSHREFQSTTNSTSKPSKSRRNKSRHPPDLTAGSIESRKTSSQTVIRTERRRRIPRSWKAAKQLHPVNDNLIFN